MDPLSALSVAAAVIQFIDYSTRIVSKGKELYKSADGALAENIELETASVRLQNLSRTLKDSLRANQQAPKEGVASKNDGALETICEACVTVSKEFVDKLENLKVPEGHSHKKWKSFRQALKTVWTKEKIEEVAQRLAKLRADLDTNVLLSIR